MLPPVSREAEAGQTASARRRSAVAQPPGRSDCRPRPRSQPRPRVALAAQQLSRPRQQSPARPGTTPPVLRSPVCRPPAAARGGFTGNPVSLDFQGADLRAVLRTFCRDQRPEHRHRSGGAGHGGRRAARRAVGSGARHHPARQQARLPGRRHDRAHRAADGAGRRGGAAAQAGGRAGARRRAARADQDAQLRARPRTCSSCSRRARCRSAARCRSTRAPTRSSSPTCRSGSTTANDADRRRSTGRSRRSRSKRGSCRPTRTTRGRSACSGASTGRVDPALGNTTNLAFPNSGSLGGRVGRRRARRRPTRRQPPGDRRRHERRRPGARLGQRRVQSRRRAVAPSRRSGNGRLLSTPRVSTQNNVEAEMTQGVQIPYQTVANNTVDGRTSRTRR